MAKSILAEVQAALPRPGPHGRYLVAYSGGLDSTVLLHVLTRLQLPQPLLAVHVHHGLQTAAEAWPQHCERQCALWSVPFTQVRVKPRQGPGHSLEAEARHARYTALQALLCKGDVLLTGHHLDDQAETLLLQLFRGAGPRGLAAMPAVAVFPPGQHARPLLACPRSELEAYAKDHALAWVEDPSNLDTSHARNFLRQALMPLLRQRWPEAAVMLGRSARLCAEAADMLDGQAQQDHEGCRGEVPGSLNTTALMALDPPRRRNLLRAWIGWLNLPLPEAQHLQRVDGEFLQAPEDAMPVLAWPGVELRRYRDQLFAMPVLPPFPTDWHCEWRLQGHLALPQGCGWLEAVPSTSGAALRPPRDNETVSVRLAQEGERIRLPGRGHSHALKKLCQDSGIAPWLRRRLPVLLYGEQLAAVADRWVCDGFTASSGITGWQLRWHDAPMGYPAPASS